MKTIYRRLLIALLVLTLPAMAAAAETSPAGDQKTSPTLQPAPQAVPAPVEKSSATPKQQPSIVVTPQEFPHAPAVPSTTPPPIIVNPLAAPQIAIPQPAAAPAAAGAAQTAAELLKAQPAILVGFIDLFRVNAESDPGKAGQAKVGEKKKKLQAQIESKRKQLDKLKESIEAQMPTLSIEQREAKSKEFRKKVDDFQKFTQNADNELQKLQQDLGRHLFEKVEKAAAEYAKSNSLSLVITRRDLLYQSGGVIPMDVTEGVVKLINEKKK